MTSLLERAARWSKRNLDNQTSVPVTIIAGNDSLEGIKAIPGQSQFDQYNLEEFVGSAKAFDWIVSASDLVFAGQKRQPAPGWVIQFTQSDGRVAYYEALPNDENNRCFQVVDPLGVLYRIHTKLSRIE